MQVLLLMNITVLTVLAVPRSRYEVVPPEDGKWGVLDSNGLYNGMIGQLTRNEVT